MGHSEFDPIVMHRRAWNAGRKVGAKRPLKPQQVWAIRFWLDHERRLRDRAMFDLAIDSKLRGCDVVKIKIGDVVSGGRVRSRAIVIQQKTGRPVQFELLEPARASILAWLGCRGGTLDDFVFPSRIPYTPTHAVKAGKRYRYYVLRPLATGTAASDGKPRQRSSRLPAHDVERP